MKTIRYLITVLKRTQIEIQASNYLFGSILYFLLKLGYTQAPEPGNSFRLPGWVHVQMYFDAKARPQHAPPVAVCLASTKRQLGASWQQHEVYLLISWQMTINVANRQLLCIQAVASLFQKLGTCAGRGTNWIIEDTIDLQWEALNIFH